MSATCRRCKRAKPIANHKRWFCASCDRNISPDERQQWPIVEPQISVWQEGYDRLAIQTRRIVVRGLWRQGFSQAAISRATGLSSFCVWRYINTECGR